MNEIDKTETVFQMANKIFTKFEVGQSCTITGFVEMPDGLLEAKGKVVLAEIDRLDKAHNFGNNTGARYKDGIRRRRVKLDNVVGDSIAHKAFKWDKREVDNQIRISIWRIQ